MVGQVSAPPTLRDVTSDLIGLRERRGITIDKVGKAVHLRNLSAVKIQAGEQSRVGEETAIAYALLRCVLMRESGWAYEGLPQPIRELIYIELNFDGEDSNYTDRQGQIINQQGLQSVDYQRHSRICYEKFASLLLELLRSPCASIDDGRQDERVAQAARLHEDFVTKVLFESFLEIAMLRGHEEARRVADRIIESLPRAATTARAVLAEADAQELDGFELLKFLVPRVAARGLSGWVLAFEAVRERPEGRQIPFWRLGDFLSADLSTSPAGGIPDAQTLWSVELLAIVFRELEESDRWAEVLRDDGVTGRSEAPVTAPTG